MARAEIALGDRTALAEFFRHADLLRIKRPTVVCRATEHSADMIDMVSRLVARGYAYVVDGNVYFEVATFPAYADLPSSI